MKTLLHIMAAPRAEASRTLQVSAAFIAALKRKYPACRIDELDLFKEELPELTVKRLGGKYALMAGGELAGDVKDSWSAIEAHIRRFLAADAYLISAPMWNFSIPYRLKHYIDVIVQPKYLFQYTEKGPEGLVKGKKAAVVTSRGGDYGEASPFKPYDQQEPYLRTVLGFVGLTDIAFINAQPMDAMGPDAQKQKIEAAKKEAQKTAEAF